MRTLVVPLVLAFLSSCAYVTRAEYDEYWDADGDGWPVGEDCNDNNDQMYPYAADLRGDGCDSDCLHLEDDADGDDWPDSSDCDTENPDIYPCAEDTDGDNVDSDCDGLDSARTDACPTSDPDYPDVESVTCSAGGDGGSPE